MDGKEILGMLCFSRGYSCWNREERGLKTRGWLLIGLSVLYILITMKFMVENPFCEVEILILNDYSSFRYLPLFVMKTLSLISVDFLQYQGRKPHLSPKILIHNSIGV